MIQPFDDTKFHFGKVRQEEILSQTDVASVPLTFLINNSPVTKYHYLICPWMNEKLPQVLNHDVIRSAIVLLKSLDDRAFRIGYNSPGAFASVNHLHIQLVHMEMPLYVENVVSDGEQFKD